MFRKDFKKPDGRALHLYSRKPIAENIVATNPPHEPVKANPHLRWHPLRGEWVAYASHRQDRTFLPPKEYSPLMVTKSAEFPTELPAGEYDVAVFDNLFPSLNLESTMSPESIVATQPATGHCEVVVFTQDPDASLAGLSLDAIHLVLKVLADRTREIGAIPEIKYVLAFENRGVEVGVTLHHPHGQIYSYSFVPPVQQRMHDMQEKYYVANGKSLLGQMITDELEDTRRVITTSGTATAFIPVCARYPYETWVTPVRQAAYLYELSDAELLDLARALKTVLMKYDKMWNRPFPYLMTLFQAPTDGKPHPESHVHFEIFPPYRTKDKLKYLAGTEIGAGLFINDSLPEEKAAELRAVEVSF